MGASYSRLLLLLAFIGLAIYGTDFLSSFAAKKVNHYLLRPAQLPQFTQAHASSSLNFIPLNEQSGTNFITIGNRPIDLTPYYGKPIVINLWATWCAPCRNEMPILEAAEAQYPDITFLIVNQGENEQKVRNYLKSQNLNFRNIVLDPSSRTMRTAGSHGISTTLFYDAHGRLVDKVVRGMPASFYKTK